MSQLLQRLPFKWKQTLVIMLTTSAALLLASTGFALYEIATFRTTMVHNVTTLARIIATSSDAALTANTPGEAGRMLRLLQTEQQIVSAWIYTEDGRLFAEYHRDERAPFEKAPGARGHHFGRNHLLVYEPIRSNTGPLGTVLLKSDLDLLHSRLWQYAGIASLVMGASTILAFLISMRLQRMVSDPILKLAQTTRAVAEDKNYSLRAPNLGGDEIGQLVNSFNEMLDQIQKRDMALQQTQDQLEQRVTERTGALELEIQERKRVEAALTESHRLYEQIALNASDLLYSISPETNRVDWYGQIDKALGYKAQEFPRTVSAWEESLHPDDRTAVLEAFRRSCHTGISFYREYRIRRKHGGYVYWMDRGRPIYDGGGKLVQVLGACSDITERKRGEQLLQQQFTRINLLNQITRAIAERQKLETIFMVVLDHLENSLPLDFSTIHLFDFDLKQLTPVAHGPRSYTQVEELGWPAQHIPLVATLFADGFPDGTLYFSEPPQHVPPPAIKLMPDNVRSTVFVPLRVEKKAFGLLVLGRQRDQAFSPAECDFLRMLSEHVSLAAHHARLYSELQRAYDELRETQQAVLQQERLRALGQMASGIAHDINNALAPVTGFTDLLMLTEKNLSPNSISYLQQIRTAGQDIANTVMRLKEFYRRRHGTESLQNIPLNQLVGQVVELMRPRWRDIPQEQGILVEMKTELDMELPPLLGNETEIRQALINLVVNAVDAMPEGGTVKIRTYLGFAEPQSDAEPESAKLACILEVCDTGIGMDDETRRRCLEPFYSTKGKRGTGLGLAMVYGMMDRHGGTIDIISAPKRGTTVRLTFPLRDQGKSPPPELVPGLAPLPRKHILCVDDEPTMLLVLKKLLEQFGHNVETASGGQAGLSEFRAAAQNQHPFDIVITDLGMPNVDGRQVAQAIKRESPRTHVIMLTGWGGFMKEGDERPETVDAILSKPPTAKGLQDCLSGLLNSRN